MSTLKMTFSLASLILIFAFVAVMPVMAHVTTPADTTHNPEGAAGTDHFLVSSITADAMHLKANDILTVTVAFAPAVAATTGTDAMHGTINPAEFDALDDLTVERQQTDGTFSAEAGFTVVGTFLNTTVAATGVGAVYQIRLLVATGAMDGVYRISVVNAGVPATDNAANVMVTVDTMAPTVDSVQFKAAAGKDYPQNDVFTEDFVVEFTAMDNTDGVGLGATSDFMLAADPANITFSAITKVGSGTFSAAAMLVATPTADAAAVEITVTATVMDKAGNASVDTAPTSSNTVMIKRGAGTPTPATTGPVTVEPQAIKVKAKSYVIVGRTATPVGLPAVANLPRNLTAGSSPTTIVAWATMPNLESLFYEGGTLLLTTLKATNLDRDGKSDTAAEPAQHLDVLITEVMAAVNEAQIGTANYDTHQWIELYNKLPVDVDVTLTAKSGTPAPDAAADTEVRLDRLSNVAIAGTSNGWAFDLGANGLVDAVAVDTVDQTPNEPFVSFYRSDRGKAGHDKAGWATSDRVYFSDLTGVHKGTPGAAERKAAAALVATNIKSDPFVINEVSTGGDWIELKNISAEGKSLKNYQLSQVTAADTDTLLVSFHEKDYMVPAGGVILIVSGPANTDIPLTSMLAGGVNVATPAADRDKNGSPAQYWLPGHFDIKSGESLLILRDNHEAKHLKTANQIVDITGGISITKDQSLVWPIVRTTAPGGKVIDGGKAFADGKVYYRNKMGGTSFDDEAWKQAVFTGLGYKRKVTNEAKYFGSPGFVDNAAKENKSDLAANSDASDTGVSISEIMYDTGGERQNLPQWIELYNSSMTQSVKLDGWKLRLENFADETVPSFNATITFEGGKIIPPNQTILLVSGARASVPDPQRYPSTRVINLYLTKNYREELELTNRTDQVLSKTGFYLQLLDKAGIEVDVVGNIDGDRRTRDTETKWDLPANGDERRSSIIRIYAGKTDDVTSMRGTDKKNKAVDGTIVEGWILASETDFARVNAPAYYGDPDDSGTPGFRAGGPLPVSLSKFRPERLKDTGEVVVRWVTESELNNAGFNILRSETRNGEFTKVHYVAGKGTTSERSLYEWKDTSAKPNVVYYYQIQDISLDGKVTTLRTTHLRGNVSAAGKATTTWGEIKALQ